MAMRSSRSRSTTACKASPVALSRVASGIVSSQAAYSACSETSVATVSSQRCARPRRSIDRPADADHWHTGRLRGAVARLAFGVGHGSVPDGMA